jgi:hypothetical protein
VLIELSDNLVENVQEKEINNCRVLPLYQVTFQRDMTCTKLRHSQTPNKNPIWLPADMKDTVNRLSCLLRVWVADHQSWLRRTSKESQERALKAAFEARHLQKLFYSLVFAASKQADAFAASKRFDVDFAGKTLHRPLWRHLLYTGQGLVGRKIFAVMFGPGNYKLDPMRHGGEQVLPTYCCQMLANAVL